MKKPMTDVMGKQSRHYGREDQKLYFTPKLEMEPFCRSQLR